MRNSQILIWNELYSSGTILTLKYYGPETCHVEEKWLNLPTSTVVYPINERTPVSLITALDDY